jgi:hypothetical protein
MADHSLSGHQPAPSIVYAGLDESGSLSADTPFFTMAAVVIARPEVIRRLIGRVALHTGKRLHRPPKAASELKWFNASQRIRAEVLSDLAEAEVELFALTVQKAGRRIEDTPENYAILACELLSHCWKTCPNMTLSLDRHFTAPIQIAAVNTFIHRHWPTAGVLSVAHVDSQRNALVQLADFVAGSVYNWHKEGDTTVRLIEGRLRANLTEDWRQVKARWLEK